MKTIKPIDSKAARISVMGLVRRIERGIAMVEFRRG